MKQPTLDNLITVMLIAAAIFVIHYYAKSDKEANPARYTTIQIECQDYELALSKLKDFEGFSPDVYICPGGYKTIGYGIPLANWGKNCITEHEADSMLRISFNEQIRISYELTHFRGRKLLAFAMLLSNVKPGSVQKSSLPGAIIRHDSTEIKAAWLSFCYANGKVLNGLKNRRDWEYQFYNSK